MHREFDPTESPFRPRTNASLYALTTLLGGLLVADLWPVVAGWLDLGLPTWQARELFGFRYALIAAVLGGARVLYGAFEQLSAGKIGADLAVAIAAIAAILIGEPLVAAEVVFIGLLGECLEAWTFDRTQRAIRGLTELFPMRCWVLRDGEEVRIHTAELVVGDTVVVKPGGKVPADGVVVDGTSAVDTSALTGESVPVDKAPGDVALAGSVVQFGSLTVRVEKVAMETVAGQVAELTAAALKDKGAGERQADRLARYFLPTVLVLASVTFLFNVYLQADTPIGTDGAVVSYGAAARLAIYPTLAVLVVACPCPLVLATPAAVVAALGRLAGTGVLVKSGSVLERLAGVTGFAFDKTGTLTEGRLELADVRPIDDATTNALLLAAATAEQRSEHPVARAVLTAAREANLQVEATSEFAAHPGGGVTAIGPTGTRYIVGNERLMADQGVVLTDTVSTGLAALDADGQTSLIVAADGVVLGLIGVRDRVRPEAAGVIAELRELGLTPMAVLTGDRTPAAHAVTNSLPGVEVHAQLLPAQKAEWIAGQPNGRTAFVGDGVNDAPALARAAVGIAIGTGTDIAADTGDVVMMGDPLRPLPLLVRLSRETAKIIRQNIIWFGFGVNLVGVFLTGWLWPLFAPSAEWFERAPLAGVLYHQVGSLAVLLNSMRLLAFERTTSSPTVAGLKDAARTADRWANALHPDEILHEIGHHWKAVAGVITAIAFVVWLTSGLTQVNADEVGIVRRFGAVRADLTPGLHARWPWPIESVAKLQPNAVHTVEVGFRLLSPERAEELRRAAAEQEKLRRPGGNPSADPALTWASSHADTQQRLTDESLMITGDGDLIEVLATARYTLSDPRAYLLNCSAPDELIRSSAEAILRELAAGRPFLDLLTTGRAEFEADATTQLRAHLATATPGGLGVRLEGLTVHDLHPPQVVVGSYHQVAEAIQQRDRLVNEAEAEATRTRSRAEEDALRTVREAEADAAAKVSAATAARDAFAARVDARTTLTPEEEAAIAGTPDAAERRAEVLVVRRFLTDFRLSLDATVAAIRGRDKVLIDADELPGRRHLLLTDPQSFRPPPTTLTRPADPLGRRPQPMP